jgi:carbon storage regulator
MFFIQRKKGESVVFGDDIIVTVIEIRGDKVWFAVEHPKEVAVHKREVYEAILSQKKGGQGTEQMSPP